MGVQQTSLLAFKSVQSKLNHNQKMVLEALEEIAPACNKEIAAHIKWPINSVTPRVLELRKKGQVVQAYTQKDVLGRKAIYWRPKNMRLEEATDVG